LGGLIEIRSTKENAMKKTLRGKLTYANVISSLCLFLLLGGGAAFAAGKLAKNSVGTKQIKNSAVTAAKIKKGTITNAKIKNGTITGAKINLAKLGTVPSATNAANATTAGTANALSPPEAIRLVGASGQPSFLDGTRNFSVEEGGFNFQPVGFYKDHEGIVHLIGTAITGKGENPLAGLIFTLPPGYRPASGTIEVFVGVDESALFVFGSNVTLEGYELSGDVFTTAGEEEEAVLSGLTFRAQS
jgi:hypothetical protein